jgi:hypothetical protein
MDVLFEAHGYEGAMPGNSQPWRHGVATTTGARGQPIGSAVAIATALAFRLVFRQPLRQTEGLLHSIADVLGSILPFRTTQGYQTWLRVLIGGGNGFLQPKAEYVLGVAMSDFRRPRTATGRR